MMIQTYSDIHNNIIEEDFDTMKIKDGVITYQKNELNHRLGAPAVISPDYQEY